MLGIQITGKRERSCGVFFPLEKKIGLLRQNLHTVLWLEKYV